MSPAEGPKLVTFPVSGFTCSFLYSGKEIVIEMIITIEIELVENLGTRLSKIAQKKGKTVLLFWIF